MRTYLRLIRFGFRYWRVILLGFVASLLYVSFNGLSMWMTASLVNTILSPEMSSESKEIKKEVIHKPTGDLNEKLKNLTKEVIIQDTPRKTLSRLCIILLICFLLKNVFFYIKNITIAFVQLRIITVLRNKLYEHIHKLSMSYFDAQRSGEITSILLNDVGNIRRSFTVGFNQLIVEPINILLFVSVLFIISWKLTLIAALLLPVTAFFINQIGQSVRRKTRRSSIQIAGIVSILSETVAGIRVVKAFAMEKFEQLRFFRETEKYFRLMFRQQKLRSLSAPVTESLGVIMGVILLWFGGLEVLSGRGLEPEDFIRFIIMLFAILGPIRKLTGISMDIQTGIASAERVFSILDTPAQIIEKPNPVIKNDFRDKIIYSNVSFKYDTSPDLVLKDVSFDAQKGTVTAIVGSSGAGKTTLLDLLPRFYDPIEGKILIDGIDIRDMSLKSLRRLMGIVTQETILFNDTIRNNIAYGVEDIEHEQLVQVAKAANAYEFIMQLPKQFDTVIGERGTILSGGQRQRIAIARALLKNPPILLLDEATSSLDTESEQMVQAAIDSLMKDRTVLVIAHRLSTIQNAHQIIVIDDGMIKEKGNHQELLELQGLYKHLFDLQYKNVNDEEYVKRK